MKVLMLSIDRGLLGARQLGDVVERHKKYGEFVDQLDIVVFCKTGFNKNIISEKVAVYPTNSKSKLKYFFDAKHVGKKLSKKIKYDLIVTQEPFLTGLVGVCLKNEFGNKLLVHLHGDFIGLYMLFAKIFVLPKADGIRVMSQGQRDKLIKAGIDENKIRVISTPVDLDKYLNQESMIKNKELRIKNKELRIILHVGRDDKVKDYPTLIKAFKIVSQKLPNTKFVQAGADLEIKKAIQNFGPLEVDILGKVSAENLINIYHRSDVVVLSSTSESFGKVLVEANACGKPVVSTATTGAKEIIQHGYNGYLVPVGNANALAENILYLLNNPELAKTMGENGRKSVQEKYGDNTEKIINFWREIIKL